MYTDPEIVTQNTPGYRSYVKVTVSGNRYRFYNGKFIGLHCFPNHSSNPAEKLRLLRQIQFELKKKLEQGWRPDQIMVETTKPTIALKNAVETILAGVKDEDVSDRYRTDMKRSGEALIAYLQQYNYQKLLLKATTPQLLEAFLQQFSSSGTYYMTQRSNLAGIFTRMVRKGWITENPVYKTSLKRKVPMLNTLLSKDQLRQVLKYLEGYNSNLYLCALMMYGCFLRPHREIRLLRRKHLNEDCTTISLSGNENKSKRIRIIKLPKYVTQEIKKQQLHQLQPAEFIMSRNTETFQSDYFKTLWTRVKREMVKKNLIGKNHTLYSFRHTGAIEVYQKTKDPYRVQQAMFHSSLTVTLVYLRSLGLLIDNNIDDLPEL